MIPARWPQVSSGRPGSLPGACSSASASNPSSFSPYFFNGDGFDAGRRRDVAGTLLLVGKARLGGTGFADNVTDGFLQSVQQFFQVEAGHDHVMRRKLQLKLVGFVVAAFRGEFCGNQRTVRSQIKFTALLFNAEKGQRFAGFSWEVTCHAFDYGFPMGRSRNFTKAIRKL